MIRSMIRRPSPSETTALLRVLQRLGEHAQEFYVLLPGVSLDGVGPGGDVAEFLAERQWQIGLTVPGVFGERINRFRRYGVEQLLKTAGRLAGHRKHDQRRTLQRHQRLPRLVQLLAVGDHELAGVLADGARACVAKRLPQTAVQPIVGQAERHPRHDQRAQHRPVPRLVYSRQDRHKAKRYRQSATGSRDRGMDEGAQGRRDVGTSGRRDVGT